MIKIPNVLYPRLGKFSETGQAQRDELEDLVDYVVLMTAARAFDIDKAQGKIQFMEAVRKEMQEFKRLCLKDLLQPPVDD